MSYFFYPCLESVSNKKSIAAPKSFLQTSDVKNNSQYQNVILCYYIMILYSVERFIYVQQH
jgi:hypothetical protein